MHTEMSSIVYGFDNMHRLIFCRNTSIIHTLHTDLCHELLLQRRSRFFGLHEMQLFSLFHQCRFFFFLMHVHQNYIMKKKNNKHQKMFL